jgi:mannitol-1-/sugar-/sorbitol-6-/2-deoxyglucose-6-phosphatase
VTLTATIFDMDGLLIDSEVLWHKAEVEILGGLGVPLDADATRTTKGMFVSDVVAHWYSLASWTGPSVSDVAEQILERVGELVESEGRLLPGAPRALDLTAARGPLALASSTPRALIERCLAHFGLRERFEVITSAADVGFGKPHPAVFLAAAAGLRVAPTSCLAFEDAPAGVLSAKSARMTCVAVPDVAERFAPEMAIADLVLDTLADLPESFLDSCFGVTTSRRRGGARTKI